VDRALQREDALAREFKNLYVYGYDSPEAYAIEKDGRMYTRFFSVVNRGLEGRNPSCAPGAGQVSRPRLVNDKDLVKWTRPTRFSKRRFTGSLLLETDKE